MNAAFVVDVDLMRENRLCIQCLLRLPMFALRVNQR